MGARGVRASKCALLFPPYHFRGGAREVEPTTVVKVEVVDVSGSGTSSHEFVEGPRPELKPLY